MDVLHRMRIVSALVWRRPADQPTCRTSRDNGHASSRTRRRRHGYDLLVRGHSNRNILVQSREGV